MLKEYFEPFRRNITGIDQTFDSAYGRQRIIYTDWTASGRLYRPIEQKLSTDIAPCVGNTHTETSFTGSVMTRAYHHALHLIKEHVRATDDDVIISSNSGMTGVVNKFQRILGFKVHEKHRDCIKISENERPVIFVTHMEHHSNQTSWLETLAEVVIIPFDEKGLVDLNAFEELLKKYKQRQMKIAAVTSCSNVTGIITPYYQIAEIIHRHGGLCFVDFAASAPYIPINMHPDNPAQKLDAIYFSPHKFLGGPGSTGILIFDKALYKNKVPDNPGGGTVDWTNPWGGHKYIDDIQAREDGGTPAFLQTIRAALSIRLKEKMDTKKILQREHELMPRIWEKLDQIDSLHVLAGHVRERLGIFSFYMEDIHYNLAVRLLNDRYGIQMRGGCSCAGTYGHFLLHVDQNRSERITRKISEGDLSEKPGWVRMSIHPTTSEEELDIVLQALKEISRHHREWADDYEYSPKTNEFYHKSFPPVEEGFVKEWFTL